jgi:hypothetical protein
MYQVQTWNKKTNTTYLHDVKDAIDAYDAEQIIKHSHPEERVLAIIIKQDLD